MLGRSPSLRRATSALVLALLAICVLEPPAAPGAAWVLPWEATARREDVRRLANEWRRGTLPDRRQLLTAIDRLEECYDEPRPVAADAERISGLWSLLYNGPADPELQEERDEQRLEGPFLAQLRPLGAALGLKRRDARQRIDVAGGKVDNVAPFSALGLDGELVIEGSAAAMPDGQRLAVTFEAFRLRLGALPPVRVGLGWVNASGWVRTTYVDDGLRVGRGDKGSVFLAVRSARGGMED
uniref:Plastid lipid-associated protein/fibrillin conserved domain-containing protein n=1 Tax=Alexandrium monilatum TaxID=311494 RepID=A0A7S4UI32_9DINO